MPIAGKLADRFDPKILVVIGALFAIGGTFPLMYIDLGTSYHYVVFVQILRGMFIGFSMMTVTVLSMSNVSGPKISRASAINNTVRQVSGSFGIAILSTVLQNRQIYHLEHISENINYASPAAVNMIHYSERMFVHNGSSPGVAHQQALTLVNASVQGQMVIFSFDDAFWILGMLAILSVGIALLLKSTKPTANKVQVMLD